MTCEAFNGLLDQLMDGELNEDERRAMEAHGADCPQCAEAMRATLQMKALFEEMGPEVDVPLAAQAKWRGAVREEARKVKRRRLTRWIGSAAAAVVVLVGVGLALNGGMLPSQKSEAPMMAAELSEGAEEAPMEAYEQAPEVGLVETDGEETPMIAMEADVAMEADSAMEVDSAMEANSAMEAGGAMEAAPATTEAPAPVENEDVVVELYEAEEAASEPMMDAEAPTAKGEIEDGDADGATPRQAPACEFAIQTRSVETTCLIIGQLVEDFDGTADTQPVEGGSANIYVELRGSDAEAFLKTVAMLDDSDAAPELPEVSEEGSLLVLLVINPIE